MSPKTRQFRGSRSRWSTGGSPEHLARYSVATACPQTTIRRVTSEVWSQRAATGYDEASADMCAPEVLQPAVDFLAGLTPGGRALGFAIGTGRG
jgi:hypothetical protein